MLLYYCLGLQLTPLFSNEAGCSELNLQFSQQIWASQDDAVILYSWNKMMENGKSQESQK
jgi:hypothetical protein